MTVWVDNMDRGNRGSRPETGRWSHLLADDPGELAAFAAGLVLQPDWLQSPGTFREHYRIVGAYRRRAIAAGAVPISYPLGTDNVMATKQLRAAARHSWHVFSLRGGTKVPAVRNWEHEATTNVEQIQQLWSARLRRSDGWSVSRPPNLGIACGPSNLVVVDLDVAKPSQDHARWPVEWRDQNIWSGTQVLTILAHQHRQCVPDTYQVTTPSGGRHLYFTAPADVPVRNSAGRLGPMIDIRGQGGYVVGPASRLHPDSYRDLAFTDAGEPTYRLTHDVAPVPLPDWLTDATINGHSRHAHPRPDATSTVAADKPVLSLDGGYGAAALRGEYDRVRSAPVGQRNHTLNAAAFSLGQLVAAGVLSQDQVVETLAEAADAAGLEASETSRTIESGLTAGMKRPRRIPQQNDWAATGLEVGR